MSQTAKTLKSAAVALYLMSSAALTFAQSREPVHVQYDGFVKAPTGEWVLSFGYLNANREMVTVPSGPSNSMGPGTTDRNQPTTFLPGRHRYACTMIMPADWDGKIEWVVKVDGYTSSTTQKPKDPLYELERTSEERATTGIEPSKATRNVCINRPPSIWMANTMDAGSLGPENRTITKFTTRVGTNLILMGQVDDDALPRGEKIISVKWRQVSGPGRATFTDPAVASTRATFDLPGAYVLELSASDGSASNSLKVDVAVEK
jgi:hypothetical protein